MLRNRRFLLRSYFILVLAMGLFGGWYANRHWRIDPSAIQPVLITQEGDWVDFFSDLGEGALQLFLGFTSE